ncbi:MerR family transcriptional regulator [Phenylobacterium montanum]|uniref:MerR family transcriptional regulator n=1 Tax=Phenylobacterium montanum TaxID=2823693 RepID=A0A975FXY8_9CAUL|nr:MerR family transcriptional regulator [Caulobacter sp. S6]QUD86877.1 MerR family transcriptional regulator [Caulobacter sp. S6]
MPTLTHPGRMKMRELEQRSGVGRETIRYYIRMGLLPEPARPKANVADYGEEHVGRLATIRRLQAQHYLPLSFIKTLLERPGHGEAIGIPGFDSLLLGRLGMVVSGPGSTWAEAPAATGLPFEDLEILAKDGVISPSGQGEERRLDAIDLRIAEGWGRMRAAGFTPEAGWFPQDIKIHADAMRELAELEIERFFTRVPGGRSPEEAAELGRAGIEIVNDMISLLRVKFLLEALRRLPGN